MAIIKIKDDKHWHDLRSKHIGGSEVAALFGASSYATPYELYHEKCSGVSEHIDTPLMHLGRMLEPIIAHYISEEYHYSLVKCEEYLEHPGLPKLGCTLDYYVVESEQGAGILEIKNVQQFSPGWSQDTAPEYVEWQVQHQLLVANAARKEAGLPQFKWAAIGSMHAGNPEDIRIMIRTPDHKAQQAIIERTTQFWIDVENGKEPPIHGSKDYETIVGLFKSAKIKEVDALDLRNDAAINDLAYEYFAKKEEEKAISKEVKDLKAKIMHKLLIDGKSHMNAMTDGYNISVKEITSTRKPQPAREVTSLRFNVRLRGED